MKDRGEGRARSAGARGRVVTSEAGFVLSRRPDTVRAPDVAFVIKQRVQSPQRGFFEGAPDLAVEVLSPSDRFSEVQEKALAWLAAGCRLVLVADPDQRTITAYRSRTDIRSATAEDVLDCSDVVAGWRERVGDFFA